MADKDFIVVATGVKAMQDRLGPQIVAGPQRRLLKHAAVFAERHARENAPSDKNDLKRSIVHEVHDDHARVFTPFLYGAVQEFGRRPGQKAPPSKALEGWVRRKLKPKPREVKGLAFVIARSIGRKGFKGKFFFRGAAEATRRKMPGWVKQMAREVERDWDGS